MIQHTNEKGEMETPEDVNHKMEKFFSDLNTQVAAKVK
jgi:hypothetical protein